MSDVSSFLAELAAVPAPSNGGDGGQSVEHICRRCLNYDLVRRALTMDQKLHHIEDHVNMECRMMGDNSVNKRMEIIRTCFPVFLKDNGIDPDGNLNEKLRTNRSHHQNAIEDGRNNFKSQFHPQITSKEEQSNSEFSVLQPGGNATIQRGIEYANGFNAENTFISNEQSFSELKLLAVPGYHHQYLDYVDSSTYGLQHNQQGYQKQEVVHAPQQEFAHHLQLKKSTTAAYRHLPKQQALKPIRRATVNTNRRRKRVDLSQSANDSKINVLISDQEFLNARQLPNQRGARDRTVEFHRLVKIVQRRVNRIPKQRKQHAGTCGECGITVLNLKAHYAIHQPHTVACPQCDYKAKDSGRMRQHIAIKHMGLTKRYVCEDCELQFDRPYRIENHMRMVHWKIKKEKEFYCDECGRGFTALRYLLHHQANHREDLPYGCEECGKRFRFMQTLYCHQILHRQTRDFACSECDSSFKDKATLKHHTTIHTGERPHQCRVCHQTFRVRVLLRAHERKNNHFF